MPGKESHTDFERNMRGCAFERQVGIVRTRALEVIGAELQPVITADHGRELGKGCMSGCCAGRLALQWEGNCLKEGIGQGTHKEVAPNLQYWMMMITMIVIMTMMMAATNISRIMHLQQPLVWP
jgi:hypothetical protein